MRRCIFGLSALALVIAASASASTRTYFGFQIGIGGAPPPPEVVFVSAPPLVCDPGTQVYVVQGAYRDDVFRYGPYWYVCDDGYWYRARSYRGPFAVIDVRYVPQPIFRVPARRWRHYPPGLAHYRQSGPQYGWREAGYVDRRYSSGNDDRWRSRGDGDDDRRQDHGHGHGKGRGHEKHGDD